MYKKAHIFDLRGGTVAYGVRQKRIFGYTVVFV